MGSYSKQKVLYLQDHVATMVIRAGTSLLRQSHTSSVYRYHFPRQPSTITNAPIGLVSAPCRQSDTILIVFISRYAMIYLPPLPSIALTHLLKLWSTNINQQCKLVECRSQVCLSSHPPIWQLISRRTSPLKGGIDGYIQHVNIMGCSQYDVPPHNGATLRTTHCHHSQNRHFGR